LVDAGDSMFESYYFAKGKEASAKLRAKTVMTYTSKMGDYYYNVGVQDFTAGLNFIKEIEKESNVNFLSANLYDIKSDTLLFKEHIILERNNLKIGMFGVVRELQTDLKGVRVNDYISTAKQKINELRSEVDILVMLANATQTHLGPYVKELDGIDYIFSSLEASRTRPEIQQVAGKPLEYKMGVQGKYIGRCDISIAEKNKPIVDVSNQKMMLSVFTERLKRLQQRDPKRKIEDIYKNSPNVLASIQRFRSGIESANATLSKVVNTSHFTLFPLSSAVESEKKILKAVDEVLDKCKSLDDKSVALSS
jgi:2',3'-cyclic-nucleotide 2'-phosphodiesterase (5'-nucleotidase family)